MSAELTIREALHDGMKLRSPDRVEKYQRAEGALNALIADRAAAARVIAAARDVLAAEEPDTGELASALLNYDAVRGQVGVIVQ